MEPPSFCGASALGRVSSGRLQNSTHSRFHYKSPYGLVPSRLAAVMTNPDSLSQACAVCSPFFSPSRPFGTAGSRGGRKKATRHQRTVIIASLPLGNFRLYALVNETRTSQKIINISGRMLRRKSMPVLRNKAGNICWRAKNMDDAAMNNAKHMRQRCRAIRRIPETLPRASMRMSLATDSKATEPRKT